MHAGTDLTRHASVRSPPLVSSFRPVRPPLSLYRWLLVVVVLGNLGVAGALVASGRRSMSDGTALEPISAVAVVNVVAAVAVRHQPLLNALYTSVGRGSSHWPLWARWWISRVHHIGGVHAGAAISATGWSVAFTVSAWLTDRSHPGLVPSSTLVLGTTLMMLIAGITLGAMPIVRTLAHDVFELTHRWFGWAAVLVRPRGDRPLRPR